VNSFLLHPAKNRKKKPEPSPTTAEAARENSTRFSRSTTRKALLLRCVSIHPLSHLTRSSEKAGLGSASCRPTGGGVPAFFPIRDEEIWSWISMASVSRPHPGWSVQPGGVAAAPTRPPPPQLLCH